MDNFDLEQPQPRHSDTQSFWRSAAVTACIISGTVIFGLVRDKIERSEKQTAVPQTTQTHKEVSAHPVTLHQNMKTAISTCVGEHLYHSGALPEDKIDIKNGILVVEIDDLDHKVYLKDVYSVKPAGQSLSVSLQQTKNEIVYYPTDISREWPKPGKAITSPKLVEQGKYSEPERTVSEILSSCTLETANGPRS